MDRLTPQQLQAFLEFVRECYACLDQEGFITHLLSGIPTLIPAEITSYTELDPRAWQSRLWLVEPSDAATSDDQRIFEAHAGEQPLIASYLRTRDGGARKNSDFLTRRQFHRTALYNEFYRRVGMEHTMAIHLGAPSLIIGLALHRARTDFSERERLLLDLLRPHLAQGYQNAQAVTRMQKDAALLRQAIEVSTQGIVVLTREGRVRLMTQRARAWLAQYFGGPPRQADHLPEALGAWIAHQEAQLGRADDASPPREPLVVEREGTRLMVRHLCEAEQCLLLLEERQIGGGPASVASFGLTRRETEVLQWVVQGKTNEEIGVILQISVQTVKKHVQHIFEKLEVDTRMAAAAVVLWPRTGV